MESARRQEESAQRQQRGVELVNGCEIVSDNEEDEEGMDSMTVLFESMMADFDEVNSNTEERKREREGEEQTENVPLYLRCTEFAKKIFFAKPVFRIRIWNGSGFNGISGAGARQVRIVP
jgi:hypothetical protein